MRRVFITALMLGVVARCEAVSWLDLWSRPDQQAQTAVQSGHPERAVPLFKDPRRRAYAELQTGAFAAAAADLAPFHDPQSQYNRGNALARNGELANALKAYDAALAQLPANSELGRNAAHNRALVAQQIPPPRGSNSQNQGAQQQGSAASARTNSGANNSSAAASRTDEAGRSPEPERDPGNAPDRDQPSRDQAARDQAQRDAAAGLASGEGRKENPPQSAQRPSPRSSTEPRPNGESAHGAEADAVGPPATEQTMAREQWLRQIPDDPGGLLRRKFLIEHWLSEREGEP